MTAAMIQIIETGLTIVVALLAVYSTRKIVTWMQLKSEYRWLVIVIMGALALIYIAGTMLGVMPLIPLSPPVQPVG